MGLMLPRVVPQARADHLSLQEREAATDPLQSLAFMSSLQKPESVVGLLRSISVSDIAATGRNRRDEQNALLTALGQLIFKDALRKLPICRKELAFKVSPELETAFTDYLWGVQQKRSDISREIQALLDWCLKGSLHYGQFVSELAHRPLMSVRRRRGPAARRSGSA